MTSANKKTTEMGRVSRVPLNNFASKSLHFERGLLVTEVFKHGVPHLESTAPRIQELDEAYKKVKATTTDKDALEAARKTADDTVDAHAARIREAQYKLAVEIAQKSIKDEAPVRSLVAGDFNIKLPSEQDLPQLFAMKDAWLESHPDAPDYTIGLTVKPKGILLEPPVRLDRITYTGALQATHIETKFQDSIKVNSEMRKVWKNDVFLSDHLGVYARFSL